MPRQLGSALALALLAATAASAETPAEPVAAASAETPAEAAAAASAETPAEPVARRYQAGPVWAFFFGDTWRALWAAPVAWPVFDLDEIGGGLRAEKTVGGFQTAALALTGADGRAYTFRSLEKGNFVPDWLDWYPATRLLRDQSSANFPAADAVAAQLARSLGLRVTPRWLGVLPDDPRLGEFRDDFAGRPGSISEFPRPGEGGAPGTFGATRITDSAELWERARRGDADVDARAYLRARLFDWWVADFDRHPGQWRWARIEGEPGWQPLPEDRDHAFPRYVGLVAALARVRNPWLLDFDAGYSLRGLLNNSRALDEWLLAGLEREAWQQEAAAFVREARSAPIDAALALLPAAWREDADEQIGAVLRRRLDGLEDFAMEVYDALSAEVQVFGSEGDDRAELECLADRTLRVRLWRAGASEPWQRRLRPGETRLVQLVGLGGDDRLIRRGERVCGIAVRLLETGAVALERGVPARPDLDPLPLADQSRPGRRPQRGARTY